jgi:phosphoglycolate phosphatase-like HAD superfamily hydrolase
MRAARLFLFDIDGTLVRLEGAGRRAVAAAFGEVFSVPSPQELFAPIRFDGNTDRAILREAAVRAEVPLARLDELRPRFEAEYVRALEGIVRHLGRTCILPGVEPLLAALTAAGDSVGLLTGNSEVGARAKLAPFDLNRFFPAGAFGSDHEDRVVLAALARERLEEHGGRRFAPEQVHVIGDSIMDVRAGRAHGFRTVAVLTGWTDRESLAAESPDLLLSTLVEFQPLP